MDFYSENPCKHCGGTGRQIDHKTVTRMVNDLSGSLSCKAKRLGLKKAYLSHLLTGKRQWTLDLAKKVIAELNQDITDNLD